MSSLTEVFDICLLFAMLVCDIPAARSSKNTSLEFFWPFNGLLPIKYLDFALINFTERTVSYGILLVLIREFKQFIEWYPYRESVVSNCVLMIPYARNNHIQLPDLLDELKLAKERGQKHSISLWKQFANHELFIIDNLCKVLHKMSGYFFLSMMMTHNYCSRSSIVAIVNMQPSSFHNLNHMNGYIRSLFRSLLKRLLIIFQLKHIRSSFRETIYAFTKALNRESHLLAEMALSPVN